MAIEIQRTSIPDDLKKKFSTRDYSGQLRASQEWMRHCNESLVCISMTTAEGMVRHTGTIVNVRDIYERDDEEGGSELMILTRTALWFRELTAPLIIDWSDVWEVVIELGAGADYTVS